MRTPHARHLLVPLVAVLGAALACLPAPRASAAPVFGPETMVSTRLAMEGLLGDCVFAANGHAGDVNPVENAAPGWSEADTAGTILDLSGDVPDFMTDVEASFHGSTTVSSAAGRPTSIELSLAGQVETRARKERPVCAADLVLEQTLRFSFVLAEPAVVRFAARASSLARGDVTLVRGTDEVMRTSGVAGGFAPPATFLAAGSYSGILRGSAVVDQIDETASYSPSFSVRASFSRPGERTTPVSGRGQQYVALAGSRDCATRSVAATVTTARTARRLKRIAFLVDGVRVARVERPAAGQAIAVPLASAAAAEVTARVLFVPRGARHPKSYLATTSYELCG